MEKKVLIIDDDENVALMLQNYLEVQDIKAFIARDMPSALQMVEKLKPQLIFLDYRMSPHTGKDILERLKLLDVKTPVVMMSAYKRREGVYEMKRMGAVEYIDKPYNFDMIDSLLKKYLNY